MFPGRSRLRAGVGFALAATLAIVLGWAAPAYAAVPDLVVDASNYDSASPKSADGWCEGGGAVGGGAYLSGAPGQAYFTAFGFAAATFSDGARATAAEDGDGFSGRWSVAAQTLCYPTRLPTYHNHFLGKRGPFASLVTNEASCYEGEVALAGNARLYSSDGGKFYLSHLIPSADLTSWSAVGREDPLYTAGSASLYLDLACVNADELSGLVRVSASTAAGTDTNALAVAKCPLGKYLVGSGFSVGGVGIFVDDVRISPTGVSVAAYEGQAATTANWSVVAYALCSSGW
ncbi:hypothetical protein [Luedemannella flava]|uniref:hypothetical protein n=1 Tax=Luedemannella flava TaxID=349316 RepID=UPI0031DAE19E